MIDTESRNHNTSILLGCSTLFLIIIVLSAFLLNFMVNQDREAARYPGATHISSHSNYTGLPFEYRWDDSYLVKDNFTAVYNWYSITFNLGAESQANGSCIQMDGQQEQYLIKRNIIVLICQTAQGQRIYISRVTTVTR